MFQARLLSALFWFLRGYRARVVAYDHVIAGMCSLAIGGSLAVYVNKEGLRQLDQF